MAQAKEAQVEKQAEAALESALVSPMGNLREAMARAEQPTIPVPAVAVPAADYRPKASIPVKDIVMAKIAGTENELETARRSLEQKKDLILQKKLEAQRLMEEIGDLSREVHDLELVVFMGEVATHHLRRDHVTE